MAQRTVILKYLLLFAVTVHLSSAEMHCLRYFFTAATPGIDFTEYTVEGRLDGEPFVHYDSKSKKMIPKTEWIKKAIPDYWDRETQNLQDVAKNFKDEVVKAMQSFNNAEGGHTVQWMYGCELDDDKNTRGYWQCGYNGECVINLKHKDRTWTAETSQPEITKQKWEKTAAARFQKAYLENECISSLQKYVVYSKSTLGRTGSRKRRSLDENTVCKARQVASPPATHSLQYFYTAVTSGINFPEFTTVGQVDGEQFQYYDSNTRKRIPKTDWIQKIDADDPDYWNTETQKSQGDQESFKVNMGILMQRFNQTKGVHTVQQMYGCELNDDGIKTGYSQFGYDGEDFLSLDLKTLTWTAAVPQAVVTKNKLDATGAQANIYKNYLLNECIEWLQKYVGYGRSILERKVPPEVDLFQKDFSSPVVCHATGFFPKSVMIFWQKNGEDLHEDVDLRETLPSQNGTFQKRSILTVSPEELDRNQYTCVIQHGGLEKKLQVSDRRVLSGGGSVGIIVGAAVAVLLLVLIGCVGVFIWKKKSGFKPVSVSEDSGSDKS